MGGLGGMNPAQAAQVLQNPAAQQMMQQMLNDPNMVQMLSQMDPNLGAVLQNPMMRSMMSNPQFINQALQLQTQMQGMQGMPGMPGMPGMQGMQGLQGMFPGAGFGMGMPAAPSGPRLDFSSILGGGAPASTPAAPTATPAAPAVPPEERFASQLQQLRGSLVPLLHSASLSASSRL